MGPGIAESGEAGAKQRGNDRVSNDDRGQGGEGEARQAGGGVNPEGGEREGGEGTDVGGGKAAFSERGSVPVQWAIGAGLNPLEVEGAPRGAEEGAGKL